MALVIGVNHFRSALVRAPVTDKGHIVSVLDAERLKAFVIGSAISFRLCSEAVHEYGAALVGKGEVAVFGVADFAHSAGEAVTQIRRRGLAEELAHSDSPDREDSRTATYSQARTSGKRNHVGRPAGGLYDYVLEMQPLNAHYKHFDAGTHSLRGHFFGLHGKFTDAAAPFARGSAVLEGHGHGTPLVDRVKLRSFSRFGGLVVFSYEYLKIAFRKAVLGPGGVDGLEERGRELDSEGLSGLGHQLVQLYAAYNQIGIVFVEAQGIAGGGRIELGGVLYGHPGELEPQAGLAAYELAHVVFGETGPVAVSVLDRNIFVEHRLRVGSVHEGIYVSLLA